MNNNYKMCFTSTNVAVVYKSRYGSTKEYAQWIAEEIERDLFEAASVTGQYLEQYDTIIYGGGLYAVGILGIKLIRNHFESLKDKNIIVFSVGLAKESPEAMEDIKEKNFSEEMQQTELIMLRGAFDLEKLSFSDRMMMKALKRKILLKDPKTLNEEELGILQCFENPVNMIRRESIQPIIDRVRKEQRIPAECKDLSGKE